MIDIKNRSFEKADKKPKLKESESFAAKAYTILKAEEKEKEKAWRKMKEISVEIVEDIPAISEMKIIRLYIDDKLLPPVMVAKVNPVPSGGILSIPIVVDKEIMILEFIAGSRVDEVGMVKAYVPHHYNTNIKIKVE